MKSDVLPPPALSLLRILMVLCPFGIGFSSFLLLPKYLTELRASSAQIGAIAAAMSVTVVLTTPLSARLVERISGRALVRMGGSLLCLTALGFLAFPEPGIAQIALRAIQGIAFSFVLTSCSATMVQFAPKKYLGRYLGYVGAALLASQALAPALFEPLVNLWGWSTLFWGGGLCGALVVLSSFQLPRLSAAATAKRASQASSFLPSRHSLVKPSLFVSAATGFSFGAVVTFAPIFALERGATSISSLFIAYTCTALIVRIAAGGLGDKIGHDRVAIGTCVIYGLVVLGFMDLQPMLMPLLGGALGMAHGLLFPSLNVFAIADTHPSQHGRVQAFFFGAFHLGVGTSGIVLGALMESIGYLGIFLISGLLSLAASLLLTLAARRRSKCTRLAT